MGWFDRLAGQHRAPLIGLDLSSSSVQLVELERDRHGRWTVARLASEPLDKGWVSEGQIERLDEVVDAVRRVVARSGTRTRRVAMALPASAVITRRIRAPAGLRPERLTIRPACSAPQKQKRLGRSRSKIPKRRNDGHRPFLYLVFLPLGGQNESISCVRRLSLGV